MRYIRLALLSAFAIAFLSFPFGTGAQLIETVAGNGTAGFNGDGISATSAEINDAFGVALDANGNIYIADTDNQRVRVVNMGSSTITIAGVTIPAGDIATIAGNGTAGYLGDGSAATSAELYNPSGVAVDPAGNIYIADLYNFRIRKVNTSGIISTVVGNGNQTFGGDNGLATNASLDPYAIAVDHNGVLYIADTYNQRIRVVDTLTQSITIAGVTIQPNYIATVAGDGNYNFSGNGVPALSAEFEDPYSIAVDGNSNIYICDTYNRLMRVVNTGTSPITVAQVTIQPGYIATVAGNGNYGFRGDGFSALVAGFADPDGIGVDSAGNIYVSDLENERIRMISNATGLISTIAGMGGAGTVGYGYNGDGIPATSALLAYPRTITVDSRANVYFSDEPNLRIREIAVNPGAPTINSRASTAFTVGVLGMFTVTTGALPAATLSESGTLPGGITFVSNGNGTATFSGIPAAGTAGSYNLLLTASNGVLPNASQTFTLTIYTAGGGPTAALVSEDTSTEGAWQSKYGADGYSIAAVSTQVIPSYATFALQNLVVTPYTWVATTNDPRALQIPGSSTGIASTWYNSASFYFDINLADGNPHQIALYMLDWDYQGRAETIQVQDANSGVTLDTESVSNFGTGIYLVWNLTGHVQIVITATAGPNGAVSGVFFGGGGNLSTPVLSILKSHTGTFAQAQQNATYTLKVSNLTGAATTSGVVTVTDTVPSGLSLVSMSGSGWSCPADANSCTQSNPLSGGASYQPITVTVNVGASATSPQVNQASVSGGGSTTATASDSTTITGPGGAAVVTFNTKDTKNQGNWEGVYGADGYSLANVTPQSIPAYATFAVSNQTNYTWTASTSDPRALQVPGGSSRIAAAWYNFSSFSFDVNLVDGNSHQFGMYALDWDNGGRAETIQIRDEVSNSLLDSRTISSFVDGVYLVWNISGHVTISVATTGGPNSVISGVFFGGSSSGTQSPPIIAWTSPSPITYGTSLSTTQLNATAAFDALPLPGTFVYTPAAGTILTAGIQTLSVTFTPTDTTDYKSVTATVSITVNQATPTINWPTPSAITYGTALGAAQLNATSTFNNTTVPGTFAYLPSAGTVLNAGSQTLSVTFTPTDLTDFTTATGTVTLQVNQPVTSSQVAYVIADSTTKGNWQGVYGADGYSIANSSQSIPAYATLAVQNGTNYTWTATTTDPRALETGNGSTRIASAWYAGSTFDFDVNFVDGNAHQFALYALDWDSGERVETIQIRDSSTNTLLDTRTISGFSGGLYLVWNISGHVTVNVTLVSGANAVISGVFFGGAPSSTQSAPVIAWAAPAAITYGTALSGTQLDATASFNGSAVAGSFVYSPAAGAVLTAGNQNLGVTFTPTDTTDYKTVTSSVSLTVNQATPTISWATPAAITYGSALSSTQLDATASFNSSSVPGTFVYSPAAGAVPLAGNQTLSVTFTPTDATDFKSATASVTLVVNPSSSGSPTVTFVVSDSSTQGNWQGSYGADGYSLANSTQSLPSYASFTPEGQSDYTWTTTTSDPRALQAASGSSRIASAWYGSAFSFDVNFTDGNSHLFAFYALDWDSGGRAETIQVLDAATNAILDTRTISNFNNGLYLVWNISGHVKITVSLLSGTNAVLSGAFFGGNGAVSVAVNPQSINLIANQSQSFTATVTGSTNQNVTWSVSPNVGTITSTGASTATYTAPSSIASAQTVTVTATSAAAPKSGSASVSLSTGTSVANFTGFDNTTEGSWLGVYGNDGYSLANSSQQSIPAYAVFSAQNTQLFTWSASTSDPRALQNASGAGRFAATWYNTPSFYFDVNLTDGNTHQIELYALDWDNAGRSETIQVLDASTNTVLDTRTISSFSNGLYLLWTISGHVKIQVTLTSGVNCVSSALFFK